MGADDRNGATRTHEPSLRELTAEMDGLRDLLIARLDSFERFMDERNAWYGERDKDRQVAVDKALIAAKEQTASSFAASKEAIVKAEQAQHDYNMRSNEFRGQLDDQARRLISRTEVETSFKGVQERVDTMIRNIEEKIARADMEIRTTRESLDREIRVVRETVGQTKGKGEGMDKMWGILIGVISVIGTIMGFFAVSLHFVAK